MRRILISGLILVLASCKSSPTEQLGEAAPASRPATIAAPAPSTSPVASSRPTKIDSFQGEYRFLSNFWPATVEYEGITYPSVEHAYQASKSAKVEDHKRIAAISDPGDAKREGRLLTLRDDWDTLKFKVMEDCVRYKFTHHPELKEKLLATGDAVLEEGNTWNDQIWGVYNGQGQNRLGKILMKVRDELKPKPATTQAASAATQPGK